MQSMKTHVSLFLRETFIECETHFYMCCSHHSVDALDTPDSAQLEGKCGLPVENKAPS